MFLHGTEPSLAQSLPHFSTSSYLSAVPVGDLCSGMLAGHLRQAVAMLSGCCRVTTIRKFQFHGRRFAKDPNCRPPCNSSVERKQESPWRASESVL